MSYGVLPADRYKVVNKTVLNETDKENLLYFYAPIIGPVAVYLYLLLWEDSKEDIEYLHHHLLTSLKANSKALMEARESLEAVGLLKTYVKEENVLVYLYELYSPLSASEFLNHPILSLVFYNNVGDEEYEKTIKNYSKKKIDYTGYSDITKKMDEVFKVSSTGRNKVDIKEKETQELKLTSNIDYDLIINSIPKGTLSEKAFNKKIKALIDNLSFIYNLDTLKMVELIRKSLNEFGMIDKVILRESARKYYQLSSTGNLPTIVYRTQPDFLKKALGDTSLRGKTITMFENISPYDFLKGKNKGGAPTAKDLKLVESLLVDLELTPAVVNVLLDYCLRKNNNKLTTAYVETIASQWKRADLKTAEEAMIFAEKEHKKQSKKAPDKNVQKPAWFDKDIKAEELSEQEQIELNDLMKEFK